jgi:hypothetical protein
MAEFEPTSVTVVGHPFSSSGMGEQFRAGVRSLLAIGIRPAVFDVYRYARRTDPDFLRLLLPLELEVLPATGIRIFHINGDEVDDVIVALSDRGEDFASGYNIIVPAWELPRYPAIWVEKLARFDEVWAISAFVQSAIKASGIDCHFVGQSVESEFGPLCPRRYFGIRESAFAILAHYDTQSYVSRKNPHAAVRLMKKVRALRPYDDVQMVLKARSGEDDAAESQAELASDLPRDSLAIMKNFESFVTHSLIGCTDCLVSLHRSEGFGRGLAEAMNLGRLALGTGWSGNMDFMNCGNSLVVDYDLIDVVEGDYPNGAGQKWAEPDEDHALFLLLKVIDDSKFRQATLRAAIHDIKRTSGNRAVGARALSRIEGICSDHAWPMPWAGS